VLEWFPALSGRQSLYTVQGTEWTQGENFTAYVKSTYAVQDCLSSSEDACLDSAIARSQYDYIYLLKVLRANNCQPLDLPRTFPFFLEGLRGDESFEAVYETEGAIIFKPR